MAGYYSVDEVLDQVTNEEFGLSDGDWSEEEGEGIYAYRGQPEVSAEGLDSLTNLLDQEVESHSAASGLGTASSDDERVLESELGQGKALAFVL